MPKRSAGLVMFTVKGGKLKILLVHPGGPFFTKKDNGHWGIPKGLVENNENSGKIVHAWALEVKDDSLMNFKSNTFELEWPPGSGKKQSFPEVDKCGFFTLEEVEKKITPSQIPLINNLKAHLKIND